MNDRLRDALKNAGLSSERIAELGTDLGKSDFIRALIGKFEDPIEDINNARPGSAVDPTSQFEESVGTFSRAIEDLSTTINGWIDRMMDLWDGKSEDDSIVFSKMIKNM